MGSILMKATLRIIAEKKQRRKSQYLAGHATKKDISEKRIFLHCETGNTDRFLWANLGLEVMF